MKLACISLVFLCFSPIWMLSQSDVVNTFWRQWEDKSEADTVRLAALKGIIVKRKYYISNLDSALLLAGHIVNFANEAGLEQWESEGYHLQGLSSYYHGLYEDAIKYHSKSLEIKRTIGNIKGQGATSYNIAVAYKLLGDLPKALEYNLQALALRREAKDDKGVAVSLQSISTVYYNQEKLEESLRFAEEGYHLSRQIDYDAGEANAAVSMANTYSDLGNYDEALQYYNIALPLYERLGRPISQATCYDNIGNLYLKLDRFALAIEYQTKGLEIRKRLNDKNGLSLSYQNIGSVYYKTGEYSKNIKNCNLALSYAREIKSQKRIYNACECLYKGYQVTRDYQNAFNYYQQYIAFKDSIEGVEKTRLIEEIESKYELKDKEAQLIQQELALEKERTARSNTLLISLMALGILAAVFIGLRSRLLLRRREAELSAELEHAEVEKLRELDELKSNFFANISHEFRTPLTLIMSPLQQMLAGTLKGDPTKYQQIMLRNANRLQALINQLLDLSKLESGQLKLKLAQGNLSQFLRATAHSFRSLADRKEILYTVSGPAKRIDVAYDKDVIEKILMNLISNAFKFTQEEGRISIDFRFQDGRLITIVEDTGIGIAESKKNVIFERFRSTADESDLQASSGIGLALTKELVQLYKGTIKLDSVEGEGTIVVVELPMEAAHVSDEVMDVTFTNPKKNEDRAYDQSPTIVTPRTISKEGLHSVLIVEDNRDVRSYLEDQLKELYNIRVAENGKQGLEMALQNQPDLIVSDVMMPEMDGNELCRSIKTDTLVSHIPVILLTAKADQSDKIEGLETGADAYLTKPFDSAELKIRIRNLIEQRTALRDKFSSDFRFTPSEVTVTSVDASFLTSIKDIIESNMEDETFSVVDLSREVGMSRSNLFRKLKALTDQSPNQIIREMRLIRAKELLEKGAGNAAEVGFMVGFNSATYFSKCFTDYFGTSPSRIPSDF